MSEETSAPAGSELLAVGKILRPHGIRGALVVEPLTDWPERFVAGAKMLMETPKGELVDVTVESASLHKGRYLVTIEGTSDRDGSEALRGLFLMIRACDAAPLGEGEYWAHELVGMKVVDEAGQSLGEVAEVFCREAQDLLVVAGPDETEFGIPFVKEFVREVDMPSKTITVDLPEGMEP